MYFTSEYCHKYHWRHWKWTACTNESVIHLQAAFLVHKTTLTHSTLLHWLIWAKSSIDLWLKLSHFAVEVIKVVNFCLFSQEEPSLPVKPGTKKKWRYLNLSFRWIKWKKNSSSKLHCIINARIALYECRVDSSVFETCIWTWTLTIKGVTSLDGKLYIDFFFLAKRIKFFLKTDFIQLVIYMINKLKTWICSNQGMWQTTGRVLQCIYRNTVSVKRAGWAWLLLDCLDLL